MVYILAGFLSLLQYQKQYQAQQLPRLMHCLNCGHLKPWRHGGYPRKADRMNSEDDSLNPIIIQRYYCPDCHKTSSVLPECIPPRRWYLWEAQQAATLLLLSGISGRAAEKQVKPSRHTIKHWVAWLIAQFMVCKDALSTHFQSLGLLTEPVSFWRAVFDKLSLGTAMRLCHVSGVPIP